LNGYVYGLDKIDLSVTWKTKIKILFSSYISVLFNQENNILNVASNGLALGLSPENGKILWENNLNGLNYNVMTISTPHCNSSENTQPNMYK
jgi:hypothetical protein